MTEAQLLFILAYRSERALSTCLKVHADNIQKEAYEAIQEARIALRGTDQKSFTSAAAGMAASTAQRNLQFALTRIPDEDKFELLRALLKNAECWLDGKNDSFIPVPVLRMVPNE